LPSGGGGALSFPAPRKNLDGGETPTGGKTQKRSKTTTNSPPHNMSSSAPPPAPYKQGDLLGAGGRYAVVDELNRGATAVVYAARDLHATTTTKTPPLLVALKVMDCPAHVPVRALKREIALSAAVGNHPNLVPLLDVFAASRREMVIVWEKVEGCDLLELLNEVGPLQEDRAAFLMAQLLRAVAFLHSSGFAHRDIKPENCLVEREGERLRLIDFGLSKHIASVATLGVG
jgi:serine/threonine protein kinase